MSISFVRSVLEELAPAALSRETTVFAWIDLVRTWNAKIDLTAARTEQELVDLLLADAAMLAARLPEGARLVDVGTGAGAPGLGVALLRPDVHATLVEPLQKRVAFLRTAQGALALKNISVLRARGEELATKGTTFDVAVSRATLSPEDWLALGRQLAPSVWVLLARGEAPAGAIDEDVRYEWPLTRAERRAVRYGRAPEP